MKRRPTFTKVDWAVIDNALAFLLAGEFEESAGRDCGFTQDRAEKTHEKVGAMLCRAKATGEA